MADAALGRVAGLSADGEHLDRPPRLRQHADDSAMARGMGYFVLVKKVFIAKSMALKKVAAANMRYTAYSSDFGEALRPVVPPILVKASYGLAVSYVLGDVAYNGWKEAQPGAAETSHHGGSVPRAVTHALIFQVGASIGIPFLIIHTSVDFTKKYVRKLQRHGALRRWAPTVVGLGIIPALPVTVDPGCEYVIDHVFESLWPVAKYTPSMEDDMAAIAGAEEYHDKEQ